MNERREARPSVPSIRIETDGTVTAFSGKVEIGQGITTALAQCVADELDVPMERVRMAPPDTDHSPDEGVTSGSRSIEESGEALRRASAEAAGAAAPKAPAARKLIGRSVPRIDLGAKVSGAAAYVQDLVLPGMVHGRVLRPPSPGARLVALDADDLRRQPGVMAVVRDGTFVGIVAESEFAAIRARDRARRLASWEERPTLPRTTDPRYLLDEASDEHVAVDQGDDAARGAARRTLSAEYSRPFVAHGALGPSCAVAQVADGRCTVLSHSQGIFPLRHELAKVLGVPDENVRAIHMEGAGCYGHNGADDVALDAALLARAVPGRPVRVQWMRDDEFAWEPYGTASVVRVSASLDAHGRVVAWTTDVWGHGHGNRPNARNPDDVASLLAARHLARPLQPSMSPRARSLTAGALRNAAPLYRFAGLRVTDHHVPEQPIRVSALRSLGAHNNVFAIESFMDELAGATGADPVAFRLGHLDDERARAVIETVVARSGWRSAAKREGQGRGLGFARYKNAAAYFACVAEVRLERDIRVTRVWGAIDAGMAVSPDGLANQAEGGIVQATSWTLKEQVRHDDTRITSLGWDSYPSITFSEVPEVEVTLIDRPEQPPLGAGEAFAGPVSAAIANAVYDAAGIRLRDLPLTRDRLIAAMG